MTKSPPPTAPANIVVTASSRRTTEFFFPPRASAARPVKVIVKTVVVRSGTARLRAAAFCMPIAIATTPAIAIFDPPDKADAWTCATPTAMSIKNNSAKTMVRRSLPRSDTLRETTVPPTKAPSRNPASADSDAESEKPRAPANAKPTKTILPVIFATKTRPSARMLTASTNPVTSVSRRSSNGSGP